MATDQNTQPDASGVLNVILHGAFAFKRTDKGIDAMMPAMDHHVYRAGNWLSETELRGVTYTLEGVADGDKDQFFDPDLNVKVKSSLQEKPPHATLQLPFPKRIKSLRVAEVPRTNFNPAVDLEGNHTVEHVATLQVLSYDFEDQNKLFLTAGKGRGHYWEPILHNGFINLHIIAAEDHFARLSNSQEDFNKCVAVLGANVKLNMQLVPTGILKPDELPPGVSEVETETLGTRNRRLGRLGQLLTQNGDANLAWYGNDALDGDPQGCGGCTN